MPEGPECAHYADKINASYAGLNLLSIRVLSGRYTKAAPNGFAEFSLPKRFGSVGVKGKFLYLEFTKEVADGNLTVDSYIWNTLGLTGGWSEDYNNHNRLEFTFENKQSLFFFDQRNFGTFHFGKSMKETNAKLETLGTDFLDCDDVEIGESLKIFQKKKNQNKTLAEIVMNQENYAGVGNYIKAEALYRARLSPHRLGNSLNPNEIIGLHYSLYNVMVEAYASKLNYWEPMSDSDKFKKVIYGCAVAPCGNEIISQPTADGRTTWWVPAIQK